MKYILLLLKFITLTAVIFAQSEQPQGKVHVRIDVENPLNTISKYLTGSHFVYAVEADELYKDERIVQWMKDSRVGTIRYPGGTVVMAYHLDSLNGIPFRTDSWDPEYNEASKDAAGFMDVDEYIAFCRNDVYMANYWNLNMGGSQNKILNTKNNQLLELNPVAEIFKMFASAMDNKRVRVDCTDKKVYGFAALDENTKIVQLFLMNKSEEVSEIEISGLLGRYKKTHSEVFDINGNHTKDESSSEIESISLEPWSVSKMVFNF
jgi:alpha-L-arabinofuranosidase